MEIMGRRKPSKISLAMYFGMFVLLFLIFLIHSFRIYPVESGFFARYLIALMFVMMVLPLVPKIKIFDIVDIKRETKMFGSKKE